MLADGYITYIRDIRRYSPRTQAIYSDVLKNFADFSCDSPDDDSQLLSALTSSGIRNYEVHLLDDCKMSPKTVNLHLSVVSGFCRWLLKSGKLASNPVKTVARPKMKKRLPEFFRKEAMDRYYKETEADASAQTLSLIAGNDKNSVAIYERRLHRLIVSILYETGIRRAELCSLKVASFDRGRRIMHVLGKGDKMREIPLLDSLCDEISLYLQATAILTGEMQTPGSPLVVTPRAKALYPAYVDRVVKEELGAVEGMTGRKSPHVLRHTLATELLDNGADLNSIKEMLGHSSLAATQVYTHNSAEKLKNIYINAHPRAKRGGNDGD